MYLIVTISLSLILMNPAVSPKDPIEKNPSTDAVSTKLANPVVEELSAMEGVTLESITHANGERTVWVKFDTGIRFEIGESSLNQAATNLLTKFAEILIKNPSTEIELKGHTDNISSLELNQYLSKIRAQTVADFLLVKKVKPAQLKEIVGKNFSEPLADNSTAAGRAANRRVDMYIVLKANELYIETPLLTAKDSLKTKPLPASLKRMMEQVIKPPDTSNDVDLEIDGLLVDDTKTKSGKDFYELFYNGWEAPPAAKNYSITVSEKPFRLTSTMILVSINENVVYQAVLQPRQDIIESQTEEALYTTQDYLANYQEIMKQLNGDDMAGSGIY